MVWLEKQGGIAYNNERRQLQVLHILMLAVGETKNFFTVSARYFEVKQMMEEGRKYGRRGRRAYLDDFQRTVTGEYIYTGPTYAFRGSAECRKKGLLRWGALSVGMTALAVVGGCIHAPGAAYCAYILIPYVLALLSACSVLWGFARLAKGGNPLRGYVYDATVLQFRLRTILTAVGAAAAVAGELLYVVLHGTMGMVPGMVIFLVSEAAVLALALLWRPLGKDMAWDRQDGGEQKSE